MSNSVFIHVMSRDNHIVAIPAQYRAAVLRSGSRFNRQAGYWTRSFRSTVDLLQIPQAFIVR